MEVLQIMTVLQMHPIFASHRSCAHMNFTRTVVGILFLLKHLHSNIKHEILCCYKRGKTDVETQQQ